MTYPENYRYTKEHEWIALEGAIGTIGITDFAQRELGDIILVDLPKAGAHLEEHQTMGTVESVKAVSEIYSPVTGDVIEVNDSLASAPEKVNQDPHGAAWFVKVKVSNPAVADALMTSDQYADYIQQKAGS